MWCRFKLELAVRSGSVFLVYDAKVPVFWAGVLCCWVVSSRHLEDDSAFIFRVKKSKKNSHVRGRICVNIGVSVVAGEVDKPIRGGSWGDLILVWC